MPESLRIIDRFLRASGGLTILYGSYVIIGSWSFMLQAFGLYGIISGLLGQCIVCDMIKEIVHKWFRGGDKRQDKQ